MKKIFHYIKEFIREDYHWKTYLFSALMMILAIYLNYFSPIKGTYFSVEEKYNELLLKENLLYFWYFLFYGIPYLIILTYKLRNENKLTLYKNKYFWITFLFILFVLSLDGGYYFDKSITYSFAPYERYIISKFVYCFQSFITTFLPIAVFYFVMDRKKLPFLYGISSHGFEAKPYLIMWLIMFPLIFGASFLPDFLAQYPTFRPEYIQEVFGLSKPLVAGSFEILYLLDFINVELMIRGFMVIGMIHILGKEAILPTTMVYLLLHFEKPLGEAIGSIFGGYILGIIAFRTRSIFGGFMIHIGIAGLLEVLAFLQYYFIQNNISK